MLNVTPPPPPQLTVAMAYGIAALSVVLGGLLLLGGRVLSRPLLSALGAVVGTLLGESLARQFHISLVAGGLIAIFGLAIIGALAARIIWALGGGALFGLAALWILISGTVVLLPTTSQPAFDSKAAGDFQSWVVVTTGFMVDAVRLLWVDHDVAVLWAICLGGGVPLVILLLLPRVSKIFMTALMGSLALVGGLLLATNRLSGFWPMMWRGFLPFAGICLALLIFSVIWQGCGELAAMRAEKERKEAQAGMKESSKKPTPPGFKDRK